MKIVNAGEAAVWSVQSQLTALAIRIKTMHVICRRETRSGWAANHRVHVGGAGLADLSETDPGRVRPVRGRTLDPAALNEQVEALYRPGRS